MTKPITSYGVPAKPTTGIAATSKNATNAGIPGKTTTSYQVSGSGGGITLGDLTVTLGSLVVLLSSGANSTLQNDKNATPSTASAKVTTGYGS